jgi:hypothetical protein
MINLLVLLIACICSGLITSTNIYAEKWDDVRLSTNDLYRIGLLTGSIFFFVGLLTFRMCCILIGLFLAIFCFALIRGQVLVNEIQYLRSMIPQLSMNIMMSKHMEQKRNSISHLLDQIIQTQQKEIILLKGYLEDN